MRYFGFLLTAALIWLAPLTAIAVETAIVNVSAVVLSNNQCKFSNPPSAVLDFGQLDPLNPSVVNASTSLTFSCNGKDATATYLVSEDGGLNSYHMVHATDAAQMIPYGLTLTPTTGSIPKGKGGAQTLTLSGSIQGGDYLTALVGLYSDTVTVEVLP